MQVEHGVQERNQERMSFFFDEYDLENAVAQEVGELVNLLVLEQVLAVDSHGLEHGQMLCTVHINIPGTGISYGLFNGCGLQTTKGGEVHKEWIVFSQSTINSWPQRALAICKPVERLIFYVRVLWQTVLYVDSQGAGSPQGNCRDFKRVKACEGRRPQADSGTSRPNRVKSSVAVLSLLNAMTETQTETPKASIEYAVSGIDCYSINISNAVVKSKRFGCELFILQLGVDKGVRCPMKKALRCRRTFEKKVILDGLVLYATNGVYRPAIAMNAIYPIATGITQLNSCTK